MKIEYTDGSIKDTEQMDDFSAELAEKAEEIIQWCAQREVVAHFRYLNPNRKTTGGVFYPGRNQDDWGSILSQLILDIEKHTGKKVVLEDREEW